MAARKTPYRVVEDPIPPPVHRSLLVTSLHGADAAHVWAIGSYHGDGPYDVAVLLRFDGVAWRVVPHDPGDRAMREVHAAAANDVWRVGAAGSFARWDGARWTPGRLELAALPSLPGSYFDLFARARGEAWAAAGDGVYRWDGRAWGAVPGVPKGSYARLYVAPDGTVFALGEIGTRGIRIVPYGS